MHLMLVPLFFILQKAKGDMKKKGKPDPYAYVPLSNQFLNKRFVFFHFEGLLHASPKYLDQIPISLFERQ